MTVSKLNKQTNPLPWIFGIMAGGILLVVGLTYTSLNRPKTTNIIDEYTVTVDRETVNLEIQASGTVEPIQSVNISPKNPGRIVKLLVDQGVIVKQGQPIAIMENEELYAQGIQAEARVKEAQAALQETDIRIQGEIQTLSAQLAQATARLEESKQRIPQQIAQVRSQRWVLRERCLVVCQQSLLRHSFLRVVFLAL